MLRDEIELESGGCLQIDSNGDIRYRDDDGNTEGYWSIGDDGWDDYADAFDVVEQDFIFCEKCEEPVSVVGPLCPEREICKMCRPPLEQLAEIAE